MRLAILLFFYILSFHAKAEYLFVEGRYEPHKKWTKFSTNKKFNFKNLFNQLLKSKTGRDLLQLASDKAKKSNQTLYDIVDVGNGSLTDTTLIRKFHPSSPEEITYVSESKVYLNKELNQYDALLDLAHELTHYVYRDGFNPYVRNFSLGEFISNTIEGKGGEVQAFLMECKIHQELFSRHKISRYNCDKIMDPRSGKMSYDLAVKRFYQVGKYYESFSGVLHKHGLEERFQHVNSEKPSFVSSAYGIPYPVAAFEEYLSVLSKVCLNDKKRLGYFKQEQGRSPASIKEFESSYKSRCADFI